MIKRGLAIFALAVSTMTGACQKETPPAPAPAPVAPGAATAAVPAAAAPPAAGNAVIEGTVKLNGTPPEMAMTKRDANPFCAKTPTREEEVVVGPAGGLATSSSASPTEPPATTIRRRRPPRSTRAPACTGRASRRSWRDR